jgi:hypothetical protein
VSAIAHAKRGPRQAAAGALPFEPAVFSVFFSLLVSELDVPAPLSDLLDEPLDSGFEVLGVSAFLLLEP